MKRSAPTVGLLLLCFALACGSGDEGARAPDRAETTGAGTSASPPASAAAEEEAAAIFASRCATCHGPEGAGNGPASAGLAPPPRNFQDPEWQASVTDEHIGKIIRYGGAAVGRSPTMPGNPDLNAQPEVVAALVVRIRSLASD